MQNIQFPVKFSFKITTLSNDFTATDATGTTVAYVRQKLFKLKESVIIYSNATKSQVLYTIKADRWLDWSAAYRIDEAGGRNLGKVARKGWGSIWKATYNIIDAQQKMQYKIQERSAWTRIADSFVGDIPILGFFTGYFLHPVYNVIDVNDVIVAQLHKRPSFFGREFEVVQLSAIDPEAKERMILGLMMMILLERERG